MLIKYDAKVQRWIATVTIDGSPCVIVSRSMLRAMQLAAWLVCAPPAGQLVQNELSLIDGSCKSIAPSNEETKTLLADWADHQKVPAPSEHTGPCTPQKKCSACHAAYHANKNVIG